MSPLLPLGLLLAGVVALGISLSPRAPYAAIIAISAAALAVFATFALGWALPATAELSAWAPASLLNVGLRLTADGVAWLLAAGLGLVCLATLLTGVARPGGPRVVTRAAILLLTFTGMAAVLADNLVTMVMAWAGLDFVYFLILILIARGEGVQPQAVLHLTLNSVGTLLAVGAALLLSRTEPSLSLRLAAMDPEPVLLLTLAAVFRLGLFPLHLGLPVEANTRQGLGTLLRLVPATVALGAVARLAAIGFAEPLRPWLTVFGVAAAVVGAAQLWNSTEPQQGLTFVIIAQSGLALLTGLWGGAAALSGVVAASLALLLGGGLTFLANGLDEQRAWLTVWPLAGVATLAGAPLTIGFISLNSLYAGWINAGEWPLWLAAAGVVLAQAFLTGGLLRAAVWPGEATEGGPMGLAGYLTGLSLLGVAALAGGWLSGGLSDLLGAPTPGLLGLAGPANWIAAGLATFSGLAGVGLWRFEGWVRARTEVAAEAAVSFMRPAWLYRLVWGAIRLVDRLTYNLAGVLEGEGALLWALVVALAVLVLFRE